MAAELSREIVRLHARQFGRGPTKAKSFVYDDFALCVLEDVLTRGEKTLVAAGKTEQVNATRRAFQEVLHDEFVAIAEKTTGRKVRAFLSQIDVDREVAAELFVFDPDAVADGEHGETPIDDDE